MTRPLLAALGLAIWAVLAAGCVGCVLEIATGGMR